GQENVNFSVTVYFYNKDLDLDMLWLTSEPISVRSSSNRNIDISAKGKLKVSIVAFDTVLLNLYKSVTSNNLLEYYKLALYLKNIVVSSLQDVLKDIAENEENKLSQINNYVGDIR